MKTIEDAAKEYYIKNYCKADENDNIIELSNIFTAGVEFAQRWIPVEEGSPERIGDQKYSEKVLVKSIDLESGEEIQIYLDWFDFVENMFKEEITFQGFMKVTHWRPIEVK